jgi:DNA-binding protein HU-beta
MIKFSLLFSSLFMNKAQLGDEIAERLDLNKSTGEKMIALLEEILTRELFHDREVTIAGFGTFSSRVRKGRIGFNPKSPSQTIQIPAVKVPKFKAGKALKDTLKGRRPLEGEKRS